MIWRKIKYLDCNQLFIAFCICQKVHHYEAVGSVLAQPQYISLVTWPENPTQPLRE